MPKTPNAKAEMVELRLQREEWLDWNRAAQKAGLSLPDWIHTRVNAARAKGTPASKAALYTEIEALAWEDEASYALNCGYCGGRLYAETRRRRYCSDRCRVRAWRVRKRRV
jgi:hypothetical protein